MGVKIMARMVISSFYNCLIDREDAISMSTMLMIDRLRSSGGLFIINTNRSYKDVMYYNRDFPFVDYIVSFNGNLIVDSNYNIIYSKTISKRGILSIIDKYPNNRLIFYSIDGVYNKDNYIGHDIYKIEVELKRKDVDTSLNNIFKYQNKYYLEFSSTNNYKGLFKLVRGLGISVDDVISIISNNSESSIIDEFPNTYVTNNSSLFLKSKSKYKTTSNNYKGVERVIGKYMKEDL